MEVCFLLILTFFFSTDTNECLTGESKCDVNAECFNTEGSYKCDCKPGYRGNGFKCRGMMIIRSHLDDVCFYGVFFLQFFFFSPILFFFLQFFFFPPILFFFLQFFFSRASGAGCQVVCYGIVRGEKGQGGESAVPVGETSHVFYISFYIRLNHVVYGEGNKFFG